MLSSYRDFRDADGRLTEFHWQLLCFRLLFVVIFEHFVLLFSRALEFFIDTLPAPLKIKLAREAFLARQTLADIDVLNVVSAVRF